MSVYLAEETAVELAPLLEALGTLMLWLGAVALAALAVAIVEAILWPLNKTVEALTLGAVSSIPGSHAVEQVFTNALGAAAGGTDRAAGKFWHALKQIPKLIGEAALGAAIGIGYLVWYIKHHLNPSAIAKQIAHALHVAQHAAARVTHLENDIKALRKALGAIPHHLAHRLTVIEHAIEHTIPREIKTTRELAKEAEKEAESAWNLAKKAVAATVGDGAIALVLAALGAIGFDLFKCSSWRGLGSRMTCGIGRLLLDLFEGAIAVMVVADICQITKVALDVIESQPVQDFLEHVTDNLDDLMQCQKVSVAPPLTGYATAPPPLQPYADLPALGG